MVRKWTPTPKLSKLPAWEEDIQELLHRFEEAVYNGAPLTFATFRRLWQEMHFSFIFETRSLDTLHEDFVQGLFASALDCLEVPLRPRRKPLSEKPPDEQHNKAGKAHAKALNHEGQNNSRAEVRGKAQEDAAQKQQRKKKSVPAQSETFSLEDLVASSSEDEDVNQDYIRKVQESLGGSWSRLDSSAQDTSSRNPEGPPTSEPQTGQMDELGDLMFDPSTLPFGLDEDFPMADLVPDEQTHKVNTVTQGTGAEVAQDSSTRAPNDHVVRIGSIFMLHALYHAQPASHHIRIYVALHLLRGLTWMAGQHPEVTCILRELQAKRAFVVGAVRRPISGTHEHRQAGKPINQLHLKVLYRVLRPDRDQQLNARRQALLHLQSSIASWSKLQHVQLLCNSYRASQERLWGKENPVQPLFDLSTGVRLGSTVAKLWSDVNAILLPEPADTKAGGKKAGNEKGRKQDDTTAAEPAGKARLANKPPLPPADRRNPQAAAGTLRSENITSGAGAGKEAVSVGTRLSAADRRRLQEAESDSDQDMPSFDDLSQTGLETAEASESVLQAIPRRKGIQAVEQRDVEEAALQRAALQNMQSAFHSLLQHDTDGMAKEVVKEVRTEEPEALKLFKAIKERSKRTRPDDSQNPAPEAKNGQQHDDQMESPRKKQKLQGPASGSGQAEKREVNRASGRVANDAAKTKETAAAAEKLQGAVAQPESQQPAEDIPSKPAQSKKQDRGGSRAEPRKPNLQKRLPALPRKSPRGPVHRKTEESTEKKAGKCGQDGDGEAETDASPPQKAQKIQAAGKEGKLEPRKAARKQGHAAGHVDSQAETSSRNEESCNFTAPDACEPPASPSCNQDGNPGSSRKRATRAPERTVANSPSKSRRYRQMKDVSDPPDGGSHSDPVKPGGKSAQQDLADCLAEVDDLLADL